MRVVYLQDHDGHKKDKDYFVEPTLGRRLCDNGVAIPYVTHLKNLEAEKEAKAKAKAKAEAEKEAKAKAKAKAEAEKEAKKKAEINKLLEDQKKSKTENATSKKANTRSKAIKY